MALMGDRFNNELMVNPYPKGMLIIWVMCCNNMYNCSLQNRVQITGKRRIIMIS